MKLAVVTARLPTGTGEAFLIPELRQLRRNRVDILLVPFRLGPEGLHREVLEFRAVKEPLFSRRVLFAAITQLVRHPARIAAVVGTMLRQARGVSLARTLAAIPKMLWLADLVQRQRVDHIHAYWASTVATVAMGAARVCGIPWSFTAHRYDIVEDSMLDEKSRSASFVRSISEAGVGLARRRFRREFCRRAQVMHLGVEIPEVLPRRISREFTILSPAALVPVKGHEVLISAFGRFARDRPRTQLLLAGEGPLREALEALVAANELRDRVRFLGAVAHEDLLSLYARGSIDVVMLASLDLGDGLCEGIPVALMEAMAYGVPVIGTSSGGTPELLRKGAGLIVPQNDVDALADSMGRLASDGRLALELGLSGRRRIEEEFDSRKIAGDFLRAISGARS